jgi:hypothetical protein
VDKLKRRYSAEEFAVLSATIKVYERWTSAERKAWARTCYGFRRFAASNVTPIEHYQPQPPMPQLGGGISRAFSRR